MNKRKLSKLESIYLNPAETARLIGLVHIDADDIPGNTRKKKGKHFLYFDHQGKHLLSKQIQEKYDALAIPPAWTDVWIAPKDNYHILAMGKDEAGRRQYIYHPEWRESRNVINYYRLILFAHSLPSLRYQIKKYIKKKDFSKNYTVAVALALIDKTAIRVGHETYFEEHDSVGLTTLRKQHVTTTPHSISLRFTGKSGVDQEIKITNKYLVEHIHLLALLPGDHLFQYKNDTEESVAITADDINIFLDTHTKYHISAKDFRTWNGTLACFKNSAKNNEKKTTKKMIKEMVEDAAILLGNTPTVARKHYIHSDLLNSIQDDTFSTYFGKCKNCPSIYGLTKVESQLLSYLEILFQEDFSLL